MGLDERRYVGERARSSSLIDAQTEGTKISKVNVEGRLLSRSGAFVKEVGDSKFNGVTCRAIDGCGEKRGERRNRKFGYIVILAEGIKEGVLEFG